MSYLERLKELDHQLKRQLAGRIGPCPGASARQPGHHSAADWDFQNPAWALDTAIYHSAPSSLRGTSGTLYVTLLASACTLVTQGRLVNWMRSSHATIYLWLNFRNQAAVGSANRTNTYEFRFYPSYCQLQRIIGGGLTLVQQQNYYGGISMATLTWYHQRITWWESDSIMFVRVERETAGAWSQMCDDLQDAVNQWGTPSSPTINRVGMEYSNVTWWDDTEIWRLAV